MRILDFIQHACSTGARRRKLHLLMRQRTVEQALQKGIKFHHAIEYESKLDSVVWGRLSSYPREQPCLQIADYCLWALQRCYERQEARFLNAIWEKVSLIRDMDDPNSKEYGTFLTRKGAPPDPEKIKCRWI